MKKMNKKLITLMFAGAICAATMGAGMQKNGVEASAATAQSYTLSNVFTTTNVKTEALGDTDGSKVTSFVFKDEGTVLLRQRDLALKWYTGAKDSNGNVVATYLNAKFAFADLNFEKIVMTVELLVPSYGYAQMPSCQEYTQEVCSGFFELPLFPDGNV